MTEKDVEDGLYATNIFYHEEMGNLNKSFFNLMEQNRIDTESKDRARKKYWFGSVEEADRIHNKYHGVKQ